MYTPSDMAIMALVVWSYTVQHFLPCYNYYIQHNLQNVSHTHYVQYALLVNRRVFHNLHTRICTDFKVLCLTLTTEWRKLPQSSEYIHFPNSKVLHHILWNFFLHEQGFKEGNKRRGLLISTKNKQLAQKYIYHLAGNFGGSKFSRIASFVKKYCNHVKQ